MLKKIVLLLMMVVAFAFQFCISAKKAAVNTTIQPIKTTYIGHIKPLIIATCSPCHLEEGTEISYDNYAGAKEGIDDIIRRIKLNPEQKGFMPEKNNKLSDSIIHVFEQWKVDGLLEK